jgi:Na+/H+ antiporter NhaD/arsenite permease-like protein
VALDLPAIRAEFPALAHDFVFLDNAGGSQVLTRVADRVRDYLLTSSVQLGASYSQSQDAGARVLAAISAGAVFFGAMTYIGNAPNFLVLTMATQGGVHMPGFFGYLGWTCVLLLPLFGLVTILFFI